MPRISWDHAGYLIKTYKINIQYYGLEFVATAVHNGEVLVGSGKTPLVAIYKLKDKLK